jgi:hypothetical protein
MGGTRTDTLAFCVPLAYPCTDRFILAKQQIRDEYVVQLDRSGRLAFPLTTPRLSMLHKGTSKIICLQAYSYVGQEIFVYSDVQYTHLCSPQSRILQ